MSLALHRLSLMQKLPDVPVLETERLLMRGRTLDDFPVFEKMWADERVTRHITHKPQTTAETWSKFMRGVGHWTLMGFGYWAVIEKETSRVIGEVGFSEFLRALEPSTFGEPEIGWVLAQEVHGKGYATEAAKAAIAWGDVHLVGKRMSCLIEPDHKASIHVAEKCGFSETFRTVFMDEPLMVLHRDIVHHS